MRGYIRAAVFDAYGTLFDVHSAAARHADALGADRERVSTVWRQKQLEYTWLRSLMLRYSNFWNITEEALDHALAIVQRDDPSLRSKLLDVYRRLEPYPEVEDTLRQLKDSGLKNAILSNGSPEMLADAVGSAGLDEVLDDVFSADLLQVYKPHPDVYALAESELELPRERIAFMTSNAWDAAGAASYGFRVVWINRFEQTWENLPARPEVELKDLADLPQALLEG